jgi:HEAT repeat protein
VAAQFGESSSSSGDNRAMVEMVVARLTHAHDSQVQEAIKAIRDMGSQFAIPPLLRLLRQAKQVEIVIGLLEHLLREGVRDLSDEYLLELSSLSAEEIIEDLEAQQSVAPAEDETMSFPVMDLSKIRKMATAEMERRDYQTAS